MARPDKVYSRFRAVVGTAALTGQFGGPSAAKELICVETGTDGKLYASDQGAAEGVVWTPEGKADPTVSNYNVAPIGSTVTVFTSAEFTDDLDTLVAGDKVWSAASGGIVESAPGTGTVQKIGMVVTDDTGDDRLIINVPLAD
jgi:hypothetical protein